MITLTKVIPKLISKIRSQKFWAIALAVSFLSLATQAAQTLAADPIFNPQPFEKDFLKIWDPASDIWTDPVNLNSVPEDGKVVFRIYYHNGMPDTTALNTKVRATLPAGFSNSFDLSSSIWADNAGRVSDVARLGLPSEFKLEYVPDSTHQWRWEDNKDSNKPPVFIDLPDGILSDQGVKIGDIPGCWDFYGYVYFKAKLVGGEAGASLEKTVDKSNAVPGDNLKYTLKYENTGNSALTSTVLTDNLPAEVNFISADPTPTSINDRELSWQIGKLSEQSQRSVTVSVEVRGDLSPGTYTAVNNSQIDASETEPVKSSAKTIIGVQQPSVPSAAFTKSVNRAEASPDNPLTYKLNYSNSGNVRLSGLSVIDDLPSQVTFVSANPSPSNITGQKLTWNPADLKISEYREITVNVKIKEDLAAGKHELINNSQFDAAEIEPISDSAKTLVDVFKPTESLGEAAKFVRNQTKGVQIFEPQNTAAPGDVLEYKIWFKNTGENSIKNIEVLDVLPWPSAFVPGSVRVVHKGQSFEMSAIDPTSGWVKVWDELEPKVNIHVFLKAKLSPSVINNQHLVNTAHVRAEGLSRLSATASTAIEVQTTTTVVEPKTPEVITTPIVKAAVVELKGPAALPKTGSEGLWISLMMFGVSAFGYLYQRSKKKLALASLEYKLN